MKKAALVVIGLINCCFLKSDTNAKIEVNKKFFKAENKDIKNYLSTLPINYIYPPYTSLNKINKLHIATIKTAVGIQALDELTKIKSLQEFYNCTDKSKLEQLLISDILSYCSDFPELCDCINELLRSKWREIFKKLKKDL